MKTILRTAVLCGLIVLVIGCRGAVGGRVTVLWPLAPAPTGAIPAGYWACVPSHAFDEGASTGNTRSFPRPCDVTTRGSSPYNYALELREDGSGWLLRIYERPE